ncbi:MAG: sirohydrochlorin cobaltochelatase [Desulfovibrionaceae bacterium]|nr:sirohydrochlorin cobaltochelatase [Desulfovibrionaceae bacterium]
MRHLSSLLIALFFFTFAALANAATPSGIVLVAFGTSMESAKPSLDAIDKAYKKAYPDTPVIWAYTSDIIRAKLAKEQNQKVFSVKEALDACKKQGIVSIRVQSLHVTGGEEFNMLQRMIVRYLNKNPGAFDHVYLGHPLLESSKDLDEVISALLASVKEKRKAGEALILMGHGNDRGPSDITLAHVADTLHAKDSLAFLATVEGANTFDTILPELKKSGVKKALLMPFMVVAGDHANNDLAGDEDDSWASQLKKSGISVEANLIGLGSVPGIQQIYLRHTKDTHDDLANPTKKD